MKLEPIAKNVFYVGVNDTSRKMFDAFLPLSEGTSYNSYLIEGSEKTVLIDTVDHIKSEELLKNLKQVKKIDYIVANHAEQDHSGSLREVLKKYPEAKVLTTAYCKSMLIDLLHIREDSFELVVENQEVSLGDKTLRFIFTPWVHWPETFSTYLIEEKILFSCDFFGAHMSNKNIFVSDNESENVIKQAKIYFAAIMMPFRELIKRNLEKVNSLELEMIAPSHGPIYKNPELILNAYQSWTTGENKDKVLIPYLSMHGSTEVLVRDLEKKLRAENIEAVVVDIEKEGMLGIVEHLVDSRFVIVGTPTMLNEAHPLVVLTMNVIRLLKSKIEFVGIIGSYGWGGRTIETIENALGDMEKEYFEPIMIKGLPKTNDLDEISKLIEKIISKIENN
ncbi:MBL fold hydrolase [Candidatus Parcubacteria bacterium]|nr:MAG: MBL fold hydrolase [Candidatus Parcubacteria bacterium]